MHKAYTFTVAFPYPAHNARQRPGGKEKRMKTYFRQRSGTDSATQEDYAPLTLKDSIERTRRALGDAYAGFDNAVDADLIDSYIYEINSLQKRYKHLTDLAAMESAPEEKLYKHSTVRALISHVLS